MDKMLTDMILKELTDMVLKDLKDVEDKLDECSRKHKTTPRKKPESRFDRKPIFRPGEWVGLMDRPAIGDTTFTLYVDPKDRDEYDILENEFTGSDMELLMLAEGRLFFSREEAEMYMSHCKAIVAAMRAQLPELEDGFDED